MLKYIDLFCGIGGFRLGFERAAKKMEVPVECVFSSDISKNAAAVYRHNWPADNIRLPNNITKIKNIPPFDILFAGFPCQPFSITGPRTGFTHESGGLIFEIIRILKENQPTFFLLENVKGLISMEKGILFKGILKDLTEAGYNVEWKVLNSKYFGLPHNRPRVFLLGIRKDMDYNFTFPIENKESLIPLKSILDSDNIPDYCYISDSKFELQKIQSSKAFEKFGRPTGFTMRIADIEHSARCLIKHDRSSIYNNKNVIEYSENKYRMLTPIECERLQGFPENWTSCVTIPQRFQLLGNSVSVPVIEQLCKQLLLCFTDKNIKQLLLCYRA